MHEEEGGFPSKSVEFMVIGTHATGRDGLQPRPPTGATGATGCGPSLLRWGSRGPRAAAPPSSGGGHGDHRLRPLPPATGTTGWGKLLSAGL